METLTIIGIIVVVLGILVAIGVGIYQVKAGRTRPKPHFHLNGTPSSAGTQLFATLSNPGGAALKCNAMAQVGRDFYEYRGGVTANLQDQQVAMDRRGNNTSPSASQVPIVLWVAAQDGSKRWWDAQKNRRIRADVNKWLAKKCESAGVPVPVQIP